MDKNDILDTVCSSHWFEFICDLNLRRFKVMKNYYAASKCDSKTEVLVLCFSKSDIVKFQSTKSKVLVNSLFYSPPRERVSSRRRVLSQISHEFQQRMIDTGKNQVQKNDFYTVDENHDFTPITKNERIFSTLQTFSCWPNPILLMLSLPWVHVVRWYKF